MLLLFFLLFTVIPITEIYLLIKVGEVIGGIETLWIILITGFLGAWAARSQGRQVFLNAQKRMQTGQLPADDLLQGILIFLGGVLLITPGFITDVVGLSMVLPPMRYVFVLFAKSVLAKKVSEGKVQFYASTMSEQGPFEYKSSSMRDVSPESLDGESPVIDLTQNSEKKEDQ